MVSAGSRKGREGATARREKSEKAMAESSEFLGFVKRHFEDVKEHWKSNFSFLDYYKKTLGRKEPLPKWTDADVEEFIASDPIYGPQVSIRSHLFPPFF